MSNPHQLAFQMVLDELLQQKSQMLADRSEWESQGYYYVLMKVSNKLVYSLSRWQTVKQLKAECKMNGLKGYSKLKRGELIKMLMSV